VITHCDSCNAEISRQEGDCTQHFGYVDPDGNFNCQPGDFDHHAPNEEIRAQIVASLAVACEVPHESVSVQVIESPEQLDDFLNMLGGISRLSHVENELGMAYSSLAIYLEYTGIYPYQIVHLEECEKCAFDIGAKKFTQICENLPFRDTIAYEVKLIP
jgi:hypothetical protein